MQKLVSNVVEQFIRRQSLCGMWTVDLLTAFCFVFGPRFDQIVDILQDPSVSNVSNSDTVKLNPQRQPPPTDTPSWLQDSEPAWAAPPQAASTPQAQHAYADPPRPSDETPVDPYVWILPI